MPDADIVVSAGRGLKNAENWDIIEELYPQDGETIILVINTEIEATGTWESQLLLKDWATEKIHRIQLFAEAYEDEANEE